MVLAQNIGTQHANLHQGSGQWGFNHWNGTSVFKQQDAIHYNDAVAQLPKAKSVKLYVKTAEKKVQPLAHFKAIEVTNPDGSIVHVSCPTYKYVEVQHDRAFEPVVEGLKLSGNLDWKFVLYHNSRFAKLQVYTGGCGYDTVCLGFTVSNSFDNSGALKYGIRMLKGVESLEVIGFRQKCSNGMKVIVPLHEAEIIDFKLAGKITELIKGQERILHTKSAEEKIQRIQYVVEALALLQKPVENLIKKAQKFDLSDRKKVADLVKLHVSERQSERILSRFYRDADTEGHNLFSLFNAVTYVASHEESLKVVSREKLIDKAAGLMNLVLFGGSDASVSSEVGA